MKTVFSIVAMFFLIIGNAQTVSLQSFATGFSSPVAIVHAGDSRLFVVQRGGLIRILNANGTINTTPFLTLTSTTVLSGGERGLLGLAFHPNYATNGFFYVNYTRAGDGATVIARYSVSTTDANVANASSAQILLTIPQPYSNHNGGSLVFGPDGFLYIGMGDGGSFGDPQNYAQNINSLLGKMLRIDVNSGSPYGIPPTNMFAGAIAGADEIWAVGMRNPWKFSFDRSNGDLWIADVGQNVSEEINKSAGNPPGLNYGWRCYEGNVTYNTSGCGVAANYKFPVATYALGGSRCSSTGGYVYRGTIYPNLQNKYFFADYCTSEIGWIPTAGGAITWTSGFTGNIATFGEDLNGELYVAGISNGIVYKLIDSSLETPDFRENGLTIAPNPAKTFVLIQNTLMLDLESIAIYDLTGKLMYSRKIDKMDIINVPVSGYQSGLYLLTIEAKDGKVFKSKLMVN
jgi:glucose/arabinose dehydrogenase